MPFIQLKTNGAVQREQEKALKDRFGEAIAILPGKSESWLMLDIQDKCRMYFKGSGKKPMALAEVQLYGKANSGAYSELTAALTAILHEVLEIEPDHIYVKYEEVSAWGWNGRNF